MHYKMPHRSYSVATVMRRSLAWRVRRKRCSYNHQSLLWEQTVITVIHVQANIEGLSKITYCLQDTKVSDVLSITTECGNNVSPLNHYHKLPVIPQWSLNKDKIVKSSVVIRKWQPLAVFFIESSIFCHIDSSQCLAQLTPAGVGIARSAHVQLGPSTHVIRWDIVCLSAQSHTSVWESIHIFIMARRRPFCTLSRFRLLQVDQGSFELLAKCSFGMIPLSPHSVDRSPRVSTPLPTMWYEHLVLRW